LNRTFSGDGNLRRAARSFGLSVIDRLPGVKRLLVGEAAGVAGNLPRLLQGHDL
jgi:2-octaprenyl-6-methoxyphenol hydroxylase